LMVGIVPLASGTEVVEERDLLDLAFGKQPVREMASDEARSACEEKSAIRHRIDSHFVPERCSDG